MNILIIGAGPTGLGAAHRLQELGHDDFTVYDQAPYVGGLATSFKDDKGFTWDFAVHVAHSHYHYVDALMEKLLPDGFYHHERKSWVHEYGAYIPYPFQNNIRHLPAKPLQDCLDGLHHIKNNPPSSTPTNFREWILNSFGDGIADHFMIPYNTKIWTTPPENMNCHWLGDRVPVVDIERVEKNIREEIDDVAWGPNHTFQFPKEGGTGAIWEALGATLPADKLKLSCELTHLDLNEKTASFDDGSTVNYDAIISTIPLIRLTALTGLDAVHQRASQLKYSHTQVVGVAPNFKLPVHLDDKTWLYCPEESTIFYRVTPFSLFSPSHVPDINKHCSFLCEISSPGEGPMQDDDYLIENTLKDLQSSGVVDATAENSHVYMMNAEFGYPIPTVDRDDILNDVIPALEEHNIFSRGRFGGWKYEVANMDHSLMQGVEAINRILLNEKEVTWADPHFVNSGKH